MACFADLPDWGETASSCGHSKTLYGRHTHMRPTRGLSHRACASTQSQYTAINPLLSLYSGDLLCVRRPAGAGAFATRSCRLISQMVLHGATPAPAQRNIAYLSSNPLSGMASESCRMFRIYSTVNELGSPAVRIYRSLNLQTAVLLGCTYCPNLAYILYTNSRQKSRTFLANVYRGKMRSACRPTSNSTPVLPRNADHAISLLMRRAIKSIASRAS